MKLLLIIFTSVTVSLSIVGCTKKNTAKNETSIDSHLLENSLHSMGNLMETTVAVDDSDIGTVVEPEEPAEVVAPQFEPDPPQDMSPAIDDYEVEDVGDTSGDDY
jgi:hypothetical protein